MVGVSPASPALSPADAPSVPRVKSASRSLTDQVVAGTGNLSVVVANGSTRLHNRSNSDSAAASRSALLVGRGVINHPHGGRRHQSRCTYNAYKDAASGSAELQTSRFPRARERRLRGSTTLAAIGPPIAMIRTSARSQGGEFVGPGNTGCEPGDDRSRLPRRCRPTPARHRQSARCRRRPPPARA